MGLHMKCIASSIFYEEGSSQRHNYTVFGVLGIKTSMITGKTFMKVKETALQEGDILGS